MIKSLVIACLIVVTGSSLLKAEETAKQTPRPNIVIAFADDWGQYASIYAQLKPGGPSDLVSTPNFDRVAREGVLFTNSFVNAPSCTPCRSSLLSGQYFWRTGRGAILRNAVWDAEIPSFPLLLKDVGYQIGYTYKVWSPGRPNNAPYGGPQNAHNKRGTRFSNFSQYVTNKIGEQEIETSKQDLLDEVRGNFQDFLDQRKEGTPFCYWWGPTNTHRNWQQGSGKKLWGIDPDQLKGKLPASMPDVPLVREDFADYLGEVQALDAGLGVILQELERIGELENTLLIVSGDHGIPGMPHGKCNLYDLGTQVPLAIRWPQKIPAGRVLEDFVCLPDLCPTILEATGEHPPEVMTGRSLLPILTSDQQGLVDQSRDYVVTGRERHVDMSRTNNLPYPQRAIRTKDYLYIKNFEPSRWPMGEAPGYGWPEGEFASYEDLAKETYHAFPDFDGSPTKAWLITHRNEPGMDRYFQIAFGRRPAEELYDLKSDPDQLVNVAEDEQFQEIRSSLENRLLEILNSTGDPRVGPEPILFENPPFTDLEMRENLERHRVPLLQQNQGQIQKSRKE